MTPAQRDKLQAACDLVDERQNANVEPAKIIAELVADHGARFDWRDGAYRLRVAGVAVTCTSSRDAGLLANWLKTATVHLMRVNAEAQS